jgi:hypothetical protein
MWNGAPTRWAGVKSAEQGPAYPTGPADPTSGRHALDEEAALTPIFTSLRRGGWRRPRSHPGPALRLAPDPVERFRDDPLTAPIPVVRALRAVDPEPHAPHGYRPDPRYAPPRYAPAPEPPADVTTWWPRVPPAPVTDSGRHRRRLAPAGW